MPLLRPGLTTLFQQALNDLQTGPYGDGMALLRWAIGNPVAWALANQSQGQYGYLDYIAQQSNPFTATGEYLEAWAGLVGILRVPAATAAGTWFGAGAAGMPLPAGSGVARGDGFAYATTADAATDANGAVAAAFSAVLAGAAGNCGTGTLLSLSPGVAGINSTGQAAGPVTGGADLEGDASLRTRMLLRYAEPPQGGASGDYLVWARAVPGVTRAWIDPRGMGAGTVLIYVMFDGAEGQAGGFPQGTGGVASADPRDVAATGDQLAVANAIYPLQSATALVYAVSPVAYPVAFALHPHTPVPAAVQAAVQTTLDMVFLALASPLGVELDISPFSTAIGAVPGMPAFTLTGSGAPILAPLGSLPVRGAVTYV